MHDYNTIDNFQYWDMNAWDNLVQNYIISLYTSVSYILDINEKIKKIIKPDEEITLSKIVKKEQKLLPFFLGGINNEGEYADYSLAKLIKNLFGVYINPKKWITLEKINKVDSLTQISININHPVFLDFLNSIKDICENLINLFDLEIKQKKLATIPQNHEEILDSLREIHSHCLSLCSNHNYYTFFALSTRSLPFKYMKKAYPNIDSKLAKLRDFLGFEILFEPKIADSKIKEDYSIWTHTRGGLFDSFYSLNEIIFDYFSKETVKSIFKYISVFTLDLREEFEQIVHQELERINWKFPDYIRTSNKRYYEGERKGIHRIVYEISKDLLVKETLDSVSWKAGNASYSEEECAINLFKLLDDLTPALFFGKTSFEFKISENDLELVR